MKVLTLKEANEYLSPVGMKIGDWNQVTDVAVHPRSKANWINYRAPRDGLLNFSHHVAGWLPKGGWKILQIDNSTGWMDPVQASLVGSLLFGADHIPDLNQIENKTFLFEFGKNENANENTELLISHLIYVFLLLEFHGYIVSSNSNEGQIIGLQDGFVYFLSRRNEDIEKAKELLKNFEHDPLAHPRWVSEIFEKRQEEMITGGKG